MAVFTAARIAGAGVLALILYWKGNKMIDMATLEAPIELQPLMLVVTLITAVIAVWWVGGYKYQEHLKKKGLTVEDEAYSRQHLAADVLAVGCGVVGGLFAPGFAMQWLGVINAGTLGWLVFAFACAAVVAVCTDFIFHHGVERFFSNVKKIAAEVKDGVESIVELKRAETETFTTEAQVRRHVRPSVLSVVTLRRHRHH